MVAKNLLGDLALDATLQVLEATLQSILAGPLNVADAPTLAKLEAIRALLAATIVVSGPLTDTELRATAVPISDSAEREYTHVVASVTASGDTIIATPAAGKAIRLHWLYAINDPSATTPPLIKVKLAAVEIYRVWALSKRQQKTGAVNGTLVVNLSGTGNVAVTAIYEEV